MYNPIIFYRYGLNQIGASSFLTQLTSKRSVIVCVKRSEVNPYTTIFIVSGLENSITPDDKLATIAGTKLYII